LRLVARLLPVVDVTDGDRSSGHGTAEAGREGHWRAALQRLGDRAVIALPRFARRVWARIRDARYTDDLAAALKGEAHRHLHPRWHVLTWGRHPAGTQRGEHVAD